MRLRNTSVDVTARCRLDHDHEHGLTAYCFTHGGCRCESCRVGRARYQRATRRLRGVDSQVPAEPTVRRLQALARIGYSANVLAAKLGGLSESRVQNMRGGQQSEVRQSTHVMVARVYEELCMKPLPRVRGAARTMTFAESQGWRGPLEWDDIDRGTLLEDEVVEAVDHAAVALAITGVRTGHVFTVAEMEQIIPVLNREQRMSDVRIADVLGVPDHRVTHVRNRLGVPVIPMEEVNALKGVAA